MAAELEHLYEQQSAYRPNPEIAAELKNKVMIMVVGATCEGKNAVMESALGFDNQFAVVGTIVSRPPRDEDNPDAYTYYPHSDDGLKPLLKRVEQRELVQYAINHHTKYIYASDINDYPGIYNMGDVVSNAVDNFRNLGFKRAVAITVISDPEAWVRRFEKRFPFGHPQRAARLAEALESFKWSLAQPDNGHYWIENIDNRPELGGRELIAVALGESNGQPEAKRLAQASIIAAGSIKI